MIKPPNKTPDFTPSPFLCYLAIGLAVFGIVYTIVEAVAPMFAPTTIQLPTAEGRQLFTTQQLEEPQRLLAIAIAGIPALFWIAASWHVLLLLRLYLRGYVFERRCFQHLQWFGAMLIAQGFAYPASALGYSYIVSKALINANQVYLDASDLTSGFDVMMAGTFVLVLATVFKRTIDIVDEHRFTI